MEEKRIRLREEEVKESFAWETVWEKSKGAVILALAGLVLVSGGILSFLVFRQDEPEIEILSGQNNQASSTVFVDLRGAVEKPGVYELPNGARLNDLLIRAGGLAAGADREWVAKNLNFAQKLNDGTKFYIPQQTEAWGTLGGGGQVADSTGSIVGKINLNSASVSQLDSLWGIGEKRAEAIIKNRPYSSPEELLSRKIIPRNVYEKIQEEITVY